MTAFLAPYFIAGGMALVAILAAFFKGRSDGRKLERAKDADAYEQHIKDIERAAGAQPRGGVLDDPHNRDRP